MKYDYFIVSPVRNIKEDEKADIEEAVKIFEDSGYRVYWPYRDTLQSDKVGLRICSDNLRAMKDSVYVAVYYKDDSVGSIFDFGMAFALKKPIILLNRSELQPDSHKSFKNILILFHDLCCKGEK